MTPHRPPAAARALLRILLPGSLHESFAGDLEERFQRTAAGDLHAARRSYWRDVLSPSLLRFRREARGMPLPPGTSPKSGRGDGIVRSLLNDLRFAARMLAKAPGFTAVAVLSLALGIGPNTAIFSLVNAVLFEDWGVAEPEGLIDIYSLTSDGRFFFSGYRSYEIISEGGTEVFERVAAHSIFPGRIEGADGQAELALGEMVTGGYFDVMGVPAARGRTFLPEEDETPGTHPVVVISDRFWQNRFGADPGLVGGEIRLNGRPYTVIGVAPETFKGRIAPGLGTDFWVPLRMYPHLNPDKMTSGDLTISGRVRAGIEPGTAIAAVETIARRYDEELKRDNPDRRTTYRLAAFSLADVKLHPSFDSTVTAMAALLFAAVGLVLLIACVNLAGFLLSRGMDRRKEMAVRIAMGAGRGAIVRQLLVESLVLSTLGATLGLVLGQVAMRALVSMEPPVPMPMALDVGMNGKLLLFTAASAVLAAVLFGLTPALEATRAPVASTLRDEAGSSGGRKKVEARRLLVAAQMALSTVLLFGAALFVRSLQASSDLDLGFSTRQAAVVTVESWANEYTSEQRVAFVEELRRRVTALPQVTGFGLTGRLPVDLGNSIERFDIPGVEPPPDDNRHSLQVAPVSPGYFEVLGIRVLDGRAFGDGDRTGAPAVAILSEAAARQYWPGESAIGKTLMPGGDAPPITVVGVVDNVKIWSLSEAPRPFLYLPYLQDNDWGTFAVVATGNAAPGELARMVQDEARAIDEEIFVSEVETMEHHLGYIYFLPRMAALMLSLVGVLALILACVGLYGMVSYGVSRRTREMGIRLALGADRQSVINMVLANGLGLVAIGGGAGIVLSLILGRFVEGFLLGVGGLDPLAILAAPVALALVAGLATWVPARRASRVDPVKALRAD